MALVQWGSHIGEMVGHTKYVVSLAFYENLIVSGSVDHTVRCPTECANAFLLF